MKFKVLLAQRSVRRLCVSWVPKVGMPVRDQRNLEGRA